MLAAPARDTGTDFESALGINQINQINQRFQGHHLLHLGQIARVGSAA